MLRSVVWQSSSRWELVLRRASSLGTRSSGTGVRLLSSARVEEPSSTSWSSNPSELPDMPSSSQPLGHALPADEHACSVSLPTWCSVVGYEEGDTTVTGAMKVGYPRFVYHTYVLQLASVMVEKFGTPGEDDCIVLPSAEAALRCRAFLQHAVEGIVSPVDNAFLTMDHHSPTSPSSIRCVDLGAGGVHGVLYPAATAKAAAKAYWQHTGEVVSSRRAEFTLQELGIPLVTQVTEERYVCHAGDGHQMEHTHVQAQLRDRIAQWANVPDAEHVFLTASGMASIYEALRSARRRHFERNPDQQGGASIVFGFPYLDTLKLCSRPEICPGGVEFFGHGDDGDLQQLEALLAASEPNRFSVLFTEVPSNPLLQCPNLERLRELADEYNFTLVVDDTISTFLNVDLIQSGLADAVCSSLTKLVSGRGDAMAGSVVTNPHTPAGRWMQHDLLNGQEQSLDNPYKSGLFCPDAVAIVRNSEDFVERNDQVNANSEGLAEWLASHPDVDRVYYPKFSAPLYDRFQTGGYGGLMSIVLGSHVCQRTFYDALNVAKGPSLGTNFTLVCTYTLLAHYHELDFAMRYNVPPNLIRIAVGLEPLEETQDKFQKAFDASRLYPKLSTTVA